VDNLLRHRLPDLLPQLWRLAFRLTGDASTAETLVQSCCLHALQRSEHTQDHGDLRRWLFSILHKRWWNDLRPQQRRRVRPSQHEHAPAGLRVFPQHRQAVAQVEALSDELRSVMLLVAVEGFACWEAAEILDIPVDTVKRRLARARIDIGMHLLEPRTEGDAQDTRGTVTSAPTKRASS